ncbi:16S rRNA (cytosine(1402)-N(4))-methyltransferase RsmH [Polynucleobacter sp. MWH-UH24A]|uniref:16S rRNA (cytosine(1402)-N(4))-methyltransferase RsmH n=1 Tax=Polynucleobacter sp. MWH-UH24A TaxID=2689110 RepID=UPI001BFDDD73|nr:16S rRNA (cytosine(1402)-N(4))-methyltransferase RsmH [Polynucleobacter sp. MWH-UH24A]QWD76258.1 16S rRNA (cytosine(1402)-N(4))-methyltransferase RsmH [Polynucleobacter sp. MWH-UH24A]
MNNIHRPVLLAEAVTAMISGPSFQPNSAVIIDGTFGRGGHAQALLDTLGKEIRLIAFDKDPEAIAKAQTLRDPRLQIIHSSFANMEQYLQSESVDAVLLDLGISSPQIDTPERGFSFRFEGPLDMRMDTTRGISAQEWLVSAAVDEIAQVIKTFGEERFATSIARAIVKQREEGHPVQTTKGLAELIASVVKTREPGQDPATRTFQAIRIFINQELSDLEKGLSAALKLLKVGGRLVVISFHSLEDRIVKQFMQAHAQVNVPRELPIRAKDLPQGDLEIIARIKPSATEVYENPRARSAVMRVAQKRGDLS